MADEINHIKTIVEADATQAQQEIIKLGRVSSDTTKDLTDRIKAKNSQVLWQNELSKKTQSDLRKEIALLGSDEKSVKKKIQLTEKLNKERVKATRLSEAQAKQLNKLKQTQEEATKSTGVLSKAFKGIGGRFTAATLAANGIMSAIRLITRGFRDAFDRVRAFDDTMQEMAGIARVSRDDLADLESKIIEVSSSSIRTSNEVAKLASTLLTLGKTKSEIKDLLEPTNNLSIGMGVASEEAGEFLVQMLNAFGESSDMAGRYADIITGIRASTTLDFQKMRDSFQYIVPISNILGDDLERTGALVGVLADNSIKAEQSGRLLASAQLRLSKQGKSLQQGMDELNGVIKGGASEIEILQVANDLFGVSASKVGAILAVNGTNIAKYEKNIRALSGSSGDLVESRMKSLASRLIELDAKWEKFILNIDNGNGAMSNFIKTSVDGLGEVIDSLDDINVIVSENSDEISGFFESMISGIARFNPRLTVMIGLYETLGKTLGFFKDEIKETADSIRAQDKKAASVKELIKVQMELKDIQEGSWMSEFFNRSEQIRLSKLTQEEIDAEIKGYEHLLEMKENAANSVLSIFNKEESGEELNEDEIKIFNKTQKEKVKLLEASHNQMEALDQDSFDKHLKFLEEKYNLEKSLKGQSDNELKTLEINYLTEVAKFRKEAKDNSDKEFLKDRKEQLKLTEDFLKADLKLRQADIEKRESEGDDVLEDKIKLMQDSAKAEKTFNENSITDKDTLAKENLAIDTKLAEDIFNLKEDYRKREIRSQLNAIDAEREVLKTKRKAGTESLNQEVELLERERDIILSETTLTGTQRKLIEADFANQISDLKRAKRKVDREAEISDAERELEGIERRGALTLSAELKLLDLKRQQELDNAELTAKQKAEIEQRYNAEKIQAQRDSNQGFLEVDLEYLNTERQQKLDNKNLTNEQIDAINAEYDAKEKEAREVQKAVDVANDIAEFGTKFEFLRANLQTTLDLNQSFREQELAKAGENAELIAKVNAKWDKEDLKTKEDVSKKEFALALGAAADVFGVEKELALAKALLNAPEAIGGIFKGAAQKATITGRIIHVATGLATVLPPIFQGLKQIKQTKFSKSGSSGGGGSTASAPTGVATSEVSNIEANNIARLGVDPSLGANATSIAANNVQGSSSSDVVFSEGSYQKFTNQIAFKEGKTTI